jgi:hypothetical protein
MQLFIKKLSKSESGNTILGRYQQLLFLCLGYIQLIHITHTVKKVIVFPVPSRDVTNQTFPDQELLNYSLPGRVWLVTSRLTREKR